MLVILKCMSTTLNTLLSSYRGLSTNVHDVHTEVENVFGHLMHCSIQLTGEFKQDGDIPLKHIQSTRTAGIVFLFCPVSNKAQKNHFHVF